MSTHNFTGTYHLQSAFKIYPPPKKKILYDEQLMSSEIIS